MRRTGRRWPATRASPPSTLLPPLPTEQAVRVTPRVCAIAGMEGGRWSVAGVGATAGRSRAGHPLGAETGLSTLCRRPPVQGAARGCDWGEGTGRAAGGASQATLPRWPSAPGEGATVCPPRPRGTETPSVRGNWRDVQAWYLDPHPARTQPAPSTRRPRARRRPGGPRVGRPPAPSPTLVVPLQAPPTTNRAEGKTALQPPVWRRCQHREEGREYRRGQTEQPLGCMGGSAQLFSPTSTHSGR